jgi:hypothetical protein
MKNMSGSMNEKNVSQKHVALTYIRDYRVMTNLKYRLITNILIPVLAILASMLIACSKTVWAWIGVIVIVYDFYMMCEVVQDYFCFGCMCKKNAFGMHFLKTGFNGVRYFENAVLVDILIRPLRIGITILIASIPFIKFGVNIWSVFDIIMISSIVSVGSLNIFRYMDMGMYICSFFFSDVDWISSDTSIDMMSWNVNIPLIIKYIPPMIVVPLLIISDAIPITAKNTSMITFNFSL